MSRRNPWFFTRISRGFLNALSALPFDMLPLCRASMHLRKPMNSPNIARMRLTPESQHGGIADDLVFAVAARKLAAAGRSLYRRNWVQGTSGNFSAVVSRDPVELAITASGVDKGAITIKDF